MRCSTEVFNSEKPNQTLLTFEGQTQGSVFSISSRLRLEPVEHCLYSSIKNTSKLSSIKCIKKLFKLYFNSLLNLHFHNKAFQLFYWEFIFHKQVGLMFELLAVFAIQVHLWWQFDLKIAIKKNNFYKSFFEM
jgi:hypothetical protein